MAASTDHPEPLHSLDPDAARLPLQPVILAGGSGTRLWPLSREHCPKQLIALLEEDESLLQATTRRFHGLTGEFRLAPSTLVLCGENHRFMTAEQLRQIDAPAEIILEPFGRNTAPALTIAALAARQHCPDSILVVTPADHAIRDVAAFQEAVRLAAIHAKDGAIVTMGTVPDRAETGFGYIKGGATVGDDGSHVIEQFVEKPHRELAEQYLTDGSYLWNSGIFVVRSSIWLKAVGCFQPKILAACESAFGSGKADNDFYRLDPEAFAVCPSDSIDYAVMERLGSDSGFPGIVIPLSAGWSDVGSWDAVWDILPKDSNRNASRGRVMLEDVASTLVHSAGRLVACVGVQDLIVIETPDAVLVADKSRVQEVKGLVGRIKSGNGREAHNHRKVHRPWGCYDSIDSGDRFQVKRIIVNPGAKLSLQMHYHRAEHWIVVRGTAEVTRGDEVFLLTENQSTYIPLGIKHRLANPGKTPLELIEVQSGAYLNEDDIVRFEDTYGRN